MWLFHGQVNMYEPIHIFRSFYIIRMLPWWLRGKKSLGWEDSLEKEIDSLEKEIATCSRILAWRISWTEELAGYSPWGRKRVRHDLATKQQQNISRKFFFFHFVYFLSIWYWTYISFEEREKKGIILKNMYLVFKRFMV